MVTLQDVLSQMLSYQPNTWSLISNQISLQSCLEIISSSYLEDRIIQLRKDYSQGNLEVYNASKLNLPAVTFCASFDKKRKLDNIIKYNSLIIIDIDKLSNSDIERIYKIFMQEDLVFAFWKSPSGQGVKGLVYITFEKNIESHSIEVIHKHAFNQLYELLLNKYSIKLDKSGSDITRLCFLSHDKNLVLKSNIKPFYIDTNNITHNYNINKSYSTSEKKYSPHYQKITQNNPTNRKIMSSIIRFLISKNQSITYDYNDWFKVAMALSNTFTFDIALNYFIKLSQRDIDKFDKEECTKMLASCYASNKGFSNFSTIIYLAKQKGFINH